MKKYDVFFIGAGPGGYNGAVFAAQNGLKVGIAEKNQLGGVCNNSGCIPTKFLFSIAKSVGKLSRFDYKDSIDFKKVFQVKEQIISKLRKDIEFLLRKNKVDIFFSEVTGAYANEINLDTEKIYAKNIVLATGSYPRNLSEFPFDGRNILSTADVFKLESIPKKILIIGGGYIGLELATIFANLGSSVVISEKQKRILPGFDENLMKRLVFILKKKYKNLKILTASELSLLNTDDDGVFVSINKEKTFFNKVIVAVGRKPYYPKWLSAYGANFDSAGSVILDNANRAAENFYIIGDAARRFQLAYTAEFEAENVIEIIMGKREEIKYPTIPYTVFSIPEVAFCGTKNGSDKTYKLNYLASGKAITDLSPEGLVSAFTRGDRVIGAEIIGENATELIHFFSTMIDNKLTISELKSQLFAHPTYSEIIKNMF